MPKSKRMAGKQRDIFLYALSTCPMCRNVKTLLNKNGVKYDYVDVDLLDFEEQEKRENEMRKWSDRSPFPMLVIDKKTCIIGDEPEEIKKALEL